MIRAFGVIFIFFVSANASAANWSVGYVPNAFHLGKNADYYERNQMLCLGYDGWNACSLSNSFGRASGYIFKKSIFKRTQNKEYFWTLGLGSGYGSDSRNSDSINKSHIPENLGNDIRPIGSVGIQFSIKGSNLKPLLGVAPGLVFYGAEYQFD